MKRLCSVFLALALLLATPMAIHAQESGQPITRGELVQLLNKELGIFTSSAAEFSDLTPDSPYYYDLLAAFRAGYLSGYPDGTVRPDQAVSRVEGAVLLSQAAKLPQGDAPAVTDPVPDWGLDSVQRACAGGLFSLSEDGAFQGDAPLTREDALHALAALEQFKPAPVWNASVLDIPTYDGHSFQGRLCLPQGQEKVDKVVVFVNGTGVNTYLNYRESAPYRFNYFDYFADRFASQDTAFFSYSTRGVQISGEAPYYTVDWDVYGTYTPQNIAKDVASMVQTLREQPALAGAELYLLGWSEGAIIAPLAVAEEGVEVDGLLLAGYPNDNMSEILDWQLDGAQTFFIYSIYFGAEGSDRVTREQYESDPYQVLNSALFGNLPFEEVDVNGDGLITVDDFAGNLRAQLHQQLLQAAENDDTQWICKNFMELPAVWFREHFALGPTEDILVKITDTPIHIFHGTYDLNCPVQGVYDVETRFQELGLDNLTTHIFPGHNHDLNYDYWMMTDIDSEGCLSIFQTVEQLGR